MNLVDHTVAPTGGDEGNAPVHGSGKSPPKRWLELAKTGSELAKAGVELAKAGSNWRELAEIGGVVLGENIHLPCQIR